MKKKQFSTLSYVRYKLFIQDLLSSNHYRQYHYFFQQGKDPDKKRKTRKRCKMSHANNGSAIEAIEKIVQG